MSNNITGEAPSRRPTRLGILMSDSCEHCMSIASAVRSGLLPECEVAVVVSNVTGARGTETARASGLPVVVMEGRGRDQRDHESAVSTLLRTYRVDMICLAGYLREVSPGFLWQWQGRVLAIHPSLLPAFPGPHAVEQALSYGVRYTGCTVFLADDRKSGAILVQRVVEVEAGDTVESLSKKIGLEESLAYPEAIRSVISGDFAAKGRQLIASGHQDTTYVDTPLYSELAHGAAQFDESRFGESRLGESRFSKPALSEPAVSA